MNSALKRLLRVIALWAPPELLTLSQWADRHRRTSRESSAEIGQWGTRPYQREPMDCFTNPLVRCIVIMSAVQMIKTEVILNAIGYVVHMDPGPILVIYPRDVDCGIFSKKRLAPMIRDTPVLNGLVEDAKSRDSGNTITDKTFPGGHLRIAGAGSPANMMALPIRYLFGDEVDKYPITAEGDPIALAEGRLSEYADAGISKEILVCSPTVSKHSRIETAYQESDQREYEVPCPACQEFQILKWAQVSYDESLSSKKKRADSAVYICEHCRAEWNDGLRWKAIHKGRYRATAQFNGIAGFRISQLCSTKKRLSQLVLQFLRQRDDPEQYKAFVNTVLAETWTDKGEAPDYENVLLRRELYPIGVVPKGGLFLTAGADVQRDRIEVEIVAWGRGRESWSIDYVILEGKTSDAAVWEKLSELRETVYATASGSELPITRLFVDSGDGTTTNDVYNWARLQPVDRVAAIKGDGHGDQPVSDRRPVDVKVGAKKIRKGLHIRHINSSFFKSEFYADLQKRPPTQEELASGWVFPPGYCHFPQGGNYGDEHFKQIVSEQLVPVVNRRTKRTKLEWQQLRARNEALDCRIYARAAAWDFGLDRFQEKHWQMMEQALKPVESQPAKPAPRPVRDERRDGDSWAGDTSNWWDV